ncbi:DsbE family thiol:disulfide interchange protein [Terricaulis silvestris]|uniref:Cytochrome c biogenesis protein CcmG n=1 Tax=Terricaulis silvestris TaxID=2686094 RepID=A0A6I6MMU2_9CAUL|nr:DsbE family thiol:disulfide interchange protein [Terricaulis silvestris]QGZ95371.1 Cytochrome c biogenesis protein CcmG [Terricaulis silvestris]
MNRAFATIPLIALVALVGVAIFLLTREGERNTISEGLIGRPAPTFALTRLEGGELLTSDAMRGRPYVINMFASWCTPCRAEHPQLMALQASGVEIVGVAYKDRAENSARFLTDLGNPYSAVAMDPEGRFGLELGLVGVPETFVIGADGTIRAVYRGPLTAEAIGEAIRPALEAR